METAVQETTEATIANHLINVHQARERARKANEAVSHLMKRIKEEHPEVFSEQSDAAIDLQDKESVARLAILAAYAETKEKKPAPGCEVKEIGLIEYNQADAFKWAVEHKMALALDVKAFEALCKSDSTRPDFVKADKGPKAYLDKDLAKALFEAGYLGDVFAEPVPGHDYEVEM